ncbi:monocarboxylate transporter 12-B-like [Saccostrea echinata]|uniref:monocarboxylate transporter 12-B-like n=1 Tax=Saccostrea echinata TaxID=191078 RepID=UPI002A80552B|nr:monocarboxylate transporter 12-B-like [Saccostrea echinata]
MDTFCRMMSPEGNRPEGGYGWVVVAAVFSTFVIHIGIQGATGIIHSELVKTTSADLAVIGWIGSLMTGLNTLSAPLVSILTELVPCRLLIITGNILISVGFLCAAFISSVPVLILCLGILPEKRSEKRFLITELFDFSLFKSHNFVLFVTAHLLFNTGYAAPFTYLPIKGEEEGFSEQSSALFITSLGAGSSIARIAFGWFSTKFPALRTRAYLGVVFTAILTLLPVAFSRSYPIIIACSAVFGACSGITHTEIPSVLLGMLGVDRFPSSLSIAAMQQGIGSLIGIPLAEMICRIAGDNNVAFFFTSIMYAMAFILMVLSFYLPDKALTKTEDQKFEFKITLLDLEINRPGAA